MVHSNLAVAFSVTSVLVAVAFTASTLERWSARRRRHDLAWTAAMALFGLGALAYLSGVATGWRPWSFKLFYLAGGVLTVPVLALGTVYLLGGRRLGDRVALAVALIGAFATGVVLTAPLERPLDADHLNAGREVLGLGPTDPGRRGLGARGHGGDRRGPVERMAPVAGPGPTGHAGAPSQGAGRLAAANVAIAVGTLLISVKRPFEVLTGSDETGFALALSVGLAVMFAGFLLASVPSRASGTAPGVPAAGPERRRTVPVVPAVPAGHRDPTTPREPATR